MQDLLDNFMANVNQYGPRIIQALIVLLIFWLVALAIKWLIGAAIDRLGFAKKANEMRGSNGKSLGTNLSSAAYWIVMLIGIMQAATVAQLSIVTDAIQGVIDPIMQYLPNVVGAAIIFGVLMIVANVVKQALSAVLVFADDMPERFNLTQGPVNVSGITSNIAYAFIALGALAAALQVLGIESISQPVGELIEDIIGIIPNILVAGIILGIFAVIAKLVGDLAKRTLPGTGVNSAIASLGILDGADAGMTASNIIARVSQFFIVLLGLVAALQALGIEMLTDAMEVVLGMGSQIVFGAIIIFAGVFLARLVSGAMAKAGGGASDVAANVIKWVIIVLSTILGISRMGLDPTGGEFILNVAQYLIMGGAAALALAFGWGGKDWAARQLENWRSTR